MLAGSPLFSDTLYIQHANPTGKSVLHECAGVGSTLISNSPLRLNDSETGTEPFALKTAFVCRMDVTETVTHLHLGAAMKSVRPQA